MQQTQFIERGRRILANGLVVYGLFADPSTASYISDHSLETWDSVADVLIQDPWLEGNLILVIDSSIKWLNDPKMNYPNLEIDMSPVIRELQGPQSALAIIPLLQGIHPCGPGDTEILLMGDDLISCLPQDGNVASYADRIAQILSNNVIPVISFQTLQQTGIITPSFHRYLNIIRNSFSTLTIALSFGIQLSLLLFVIYSLLWSSSPRTFLSKLPWPLYAAGGFSLILLGLLHLFFLFWIDNAIRIALPFIATEYYSLIVEVLEVLTSGIQYQWLVWSIYLIIAGLLLHILIFSYDWIKKRRIQEIEPEGKKRHRIRKQYR